MASSVTKDTFLKNLKKKQSWKNTLTICITFSRIESFIQTIPNQSHQHTRKPSDVSFALFWFCFKCQYLPPKSACPVHLTHPTTHQRLLLKTHRITAIRIKFATKKKIVKNTQVHWFSRPASMCVRGQLCFFLLQWFRTWMRKRFENSVGCESSGFRISKKSYHDFSCYQRLHCIERPN